MAVFPRYVSFQRVNPEDFGLTELDVRSRIWLVAEGPGSAEEPLGGHLAAGAILKMQANIFYRLLGWLASTPPTSWIARLFYTLIAANRHRLPGGSRACKIEDNYLP
jgi:hypothetical protein